MDEESYPALAAYLAELAATETEVHRCLADVGYCDLAALRAIITLTARVPDATTRVVLHRVPRQLRTIMAIVGWDQTPGLVIASGPAVVRRGGQARG
ncbi:MAG: STAS domain-containing protein [Streptosporangiaceae bacterium]